jgi:1,4-alpha-glucan branching enzyme
MAKKKNRVFKLTAPDAKKVSLAGSFNDWEKVAMEAGAKGVWRLQVALEPGEHEYRFFVDGHWQDDPTCEEHRSNDFGTQNCIKRV